MIVSWFRRQRDLCGAGKNDTRTRTLGHAVVNEGSWSRPFDFLLVHDYHMKTLLAAQRFLLRSLSFFAP